LGISQLSKIDSFMGKRREIAAIYDSSFKKLKNLEIIQSSTRKFSGNHLYIVMVKFDKIKMSKGELYSILETFGIKAHVHYIPIPMQPYYKEKFHEDINNYPQALAYYRGAVTLPLHTQLTNKNVEHIVNTLKEVVG
jgi:dTDP-4-amino-4,6-dideoxygalactose transaminase